MNSSMSQLSRRIVFSIVCLGLVISLFCTATGRAQDGPGLSLELPGELGLDGIGGGFGPVGPLVTVEASYKVRENSNDGLMELKVTVADEYHIYSTTQGRNELGGPLPTKIKIRGNENVQVLEGAITTDKEPEIHHYESEYGDLDVEEFKGEVTFTAIIQFAEGVDAAKQEFSVLLESLACTNDLGQCVPQDVEAEVSFAGTFSGEAPEVASPASSDGGGRKNDLKSPAPFWQVALLSLLGGFILNFMPCVLPVIGLKVMSFVQQAGENRAQIFKLNLWYSLGLLSVFLVFAGLATGIGLGWGQQNQFDTFNIVMISVIFVMGLSFIGIWEIPIPGFVGSSKMAQDAEKEGPAAAFTKGIVTTLLAIPCSGPGVGVAIGYCTYAMAAHPGAPGVALVFTVFILMALGMALPYLILGARPSLVKFLPKPGAWMETFKEIMGYVLLGTIIFILTYVDIELVVPTVAFLFGLWPACWWFGRVPFTASKAKKVRNRFGAVCFATLIGLFSFTWFADLMEARFDKRVDQILAASGGTAQGSEDLFTAARLDKLLSEGRYVMVDFTADWCLTCKVLEKAVLKTDKVQQALDDRKVVQLIADWSDKDSPLGEQISNELDQLGKGKQLPIIAFYFPNDRDNPRTLVAAYTTDGVMEIVNEIPVPEPADELVGESTPNTGTISVN